MEFVDRPHVVVVVVVVVRDGRSSRDPAAG
jgi:hypothetical protein